MAGGVSVASRNELYRTCFFQQAGSNLQEAQVAEELRYIPRVVGARTQLYENKGPYQRSFPLALRAQHVCTQNSSFPCKIFQGQVNGSTQTEVLSPECIRVQGSVVAHVCHNTRPATLQ